MLGHFIIIAALRDINIWGGATESSWEISGTLRQMIYVNDGWLIMKNPNLFINLFLKFIIIKV